MKVIPVQGAGQVQDKSTPESTRTAKAVAAFKAGTSSYDKTTNSTAQEHPVRDANNVSVEELGAIKAQVAVDIDKSTHEEATEETVEAPIAPKVDPRQQEFDKLARQERAFRSKIQQQEQALKAREAAIAAREAELTAKNTEYSSDRYVSVEDFKTDPLAVMAKTGLSYDQLTEQLLNQPQRDPRMEATIKKLEAKIQSLESANETSQKTYQEREEANYQAAVRQISQDAKALIKSDPIAFEAISKTGSVSDVVELITETYNKDGIVLSVEDAAKQVEDYLVEEGFNTVSKIDKIKKRMQANAQPAASEKTPNPTNKQPQTMKTLTNSVGAQKPLSVRDRAIAAMEGRLK